MYPAIFGTLMSSFRIGKTNPATISASALTAARTHTLPDATDTLVGLAATQTLTNKWIVPRVQSVASAATITPDGDLYQKIDITALAVAATIAAPTGTPVNGQRLQIDIKDDATSRALTWNVIYSAGYGTSLPSTTTLSKRVKLGFEYNTNTVKWELMVKSQEA